MLIRAGQTIRFLRKKSPFRDGKDFHESFHQLAEQGEQGTDVHLTAAVDGCVGSVVQQVVELLCLGIIAGVAADKSLQERIETVCLWLLG